MHGRFFARPAQKQNEKSDKGADDGEMIGYQVQVSGVQVPSFR
ncbi:MAG TPA: hypothetical protein VNL73_09160 [Verrucomicrobiae bacterium]|nr:hypothetical protein [Verrucomicrobiae bacterium]